MRRIVLIVAGLLLVGGCAKPPAQENLLIPINALCTTCEDFVRCDAAASNAAVYNPSFELYNFRPKGTAAQIATIWSFLIQIVSPKTEDQRPLIVYAQQPGRTQAFERITQPESVATTDLVQHRIHVPGGWINQVNGDWHAADGTVRGSCKVLSRTDGEAVAALFQKSTTASPPGP